jgi:hypothetical protein
VRGPAEQRFWAKVEKTATCWVWTACRHPQGYGQFGCAGRIVKAHRVAWELTHGPIPDGLQVCHRCDNPPCVNPDHLFLGTQRDNNHDCIAKGRAKNLRGAAHGRARLSAEDVLAIRATHPAASYSALARHYGVSKATIAAVVQGRNWAHQEGATAC